LDTSTRIRTPLIKSEAWQTNFSPDGHWVVFGQGAGHVSKLFVAPLEGEAEIFEKQWIPLNDGHSWDDKPRWSLDGNLVYFTSDRGGSPQIYRVSAGGGDVQRITFSGDYNVSPRVSPDGKTLAYVSRSGGRFQVAAMDLGTRQTQILTDGARDESPSFAPNGKMILYATDAGGRGVLAATSSDGRVKQRLSMPAADVREPAWGPYSPN